MKTRYLSPLPLLAAIVLGSGVAIPAWAEAPMTPDSVQDFSIRRLRLTNACARCDLSGVDLSNQHLIGADLREAILTGANLSGSNLEGADLTKADLTGANLSNTFLNGTSLVSATLDYANLSGAQIYYADVTGASMAELNLAGATVVGTPLSIGDGPEIMEEATPPILDFEDFWPLPPLEDPGPYPDSLIDVPPQVLPDV